MGVLAQLCDVAANAFDKSPAAAATLHALVTQHIGTLIGRLESLLGRMLAGVKQQVSEKAKQMPEQDALMQASLYTANQGEEMLQLLRLLDFALLYPSPLQRSKKTPSDIAATLLQDGLVRVLASFLSQPVSKSVLVALHPRCWELIRLLLALCFFSPPVTLYVHKIPALARLLFSPELAVAHPAAMLMWVLIQNMWLDQPQADCSSVTNSFLSAFRSWALQAIDLKRVPEDAKQSDLAQQNLGLEVVRDLVVNVDKWASRSDSIKPLLSIKSSKPNIAKLVQMFRDDEATLKQYIPLLAKLESEQAKVKVDEDEQVVEAKSEARRQKREEEFTLIDPVKKLQATQARLVRQLQSVLKSLVEGKGKKD